MNFSHIIASTQPSSTSGPGWRLSALLAAARDDGTEALIDAVAMLRTSAMTIGNSIGCARSGGPGPS